MWACEDKYGRDVFQMVQGVLSLTRLNPSLDGHSPAGALCDKHVFPDNHVPWFLQPRAALPAVALPAFKAVGKSGCRPSKRI